MTPAHAGHSLESRLLLTSFLVDTPLDVVDGGDGVTSLREAITAANATTAHDDIGFAPGLAGSTLTLSLGVLTISEELTINGLGADQLTISGGGASKIFDVSDGSDSTVIDVDINDLSLTGGDGSGGVEPGAGGAIFNSEALVLRRVHLFGNSATTGGAVHSEHITRIFSSAVTDNFAELNGGGLYGTRDVMVGQGSSLIVNNSTVDGNSANHDGGGIYLSGEGNTVSGSVIHATVTGNTADANGADEGATGPGTGGGVFIDTSSGFASVNLFTAIVAGNDANGSPNDIGGSVELTFHSLVGDAGSAGGLTDGVDGNIVGDGGTGVLPLASIVGPLQNNGGPTPTRALADGSPAIDAGVDQNQIQGEDGLPFPFDQRGAGFARVIDGDDDGEARIDMGAFEAAKPPSPFAGGPDIIGQASTGTLVVLESDGSSFTSHVWGGLHPGPELYYGDFNGDGLTDAAYRIGGGGHSEARVMVMRNNGQGFDPADWVGSANSAKTYIERFSGDFNGDGLDDHYFYADDGTWEVSVTQDATHMSVSSIEVGGWDPSFTYSDIQLGDFNSDGLTDVIGRNNVGHWVVGLSSGGVNDAGLTFSSFGVLSTNVTWDDVHIADLNGDGRSDLLARASTGTIVAGLSDGTSFQFSVWGGLSTNVTWEFRIGDFNGDGSADLVGLASTGTIVVGLSTGSTFNFSVWGGVSTNVTWPQIVVGDFDFDGTSDLAMRASSGTWIVGISDGTAFSFSVWGGWSTVVDWDKVASGDFVSP